MDFMCLPLRCFVFGLLDECSFSAQDKYHLTASFMLVKADGCPWGEVTFEYPVCPVKEHIGLELLLSSFEIRKGAKVAVIEFDYHLLCF